MARCSWKSPSSLQLLCLFVIALLTGGRAVMAQEPGTVSTGPPLSADPVLAAFVRDALESRPELAAASAIVQANLERVPQAKALPDPVVSLGIQNDGFRGIQIGKMESSWLLLMASQTLPWSGKRGLRGASSSLEVRQSEADLDRLRLTVRADVERAYVDLLLTRDRLGFLGKLDALWAQAERMARVRYEVGEGAQSDVIRAQLELSRLKQRRSALEAEERRRVIVLNRIRGRASEATAPTNRSLFDLPDPVLPGVASELEAALTMSPELRKSRLAIDQSTTLIDLAVKDYYPDVTVSAGLMPRGGPFPPMWQIGVSLSIPIWGADKQSRAIEENRIRESASRFGAETIHEVLNQRISERLVLLGALIEVNRLYRSGLLVQSDIAVQSTMAQYEVGRVPFASVLEVLSGYVADLDAFVESVAATHRVEIAERELSLESPAGGESGAMGSSSVPGAGAMSESASPVGTAPSIEAASTGSMKRM